MRNRSYLNCVLTVIAVVMTLHLAVAVADRPWLPSAGASEAALQPRGDEPPLPLNATEQRRQMFAQLEQINRRLVQIESKLEAGINVKVTEMPPVTVTER